MGRTVFFTSRTFGDPVRTLEVRCDYFQIETQPDIVQRGAGGDVQRSILPRVLYLVNVDPADMRDLRGIEWTEMAWDDSEKGQRIERSVRDIEIHGKDLRCRF